MDANRLPPWPPGQNKIQKARGSGREAANIPLPQSDNADLVVPDSEQDLALRSEVPVSIVAGSSGVHVTQMADGSARSSAVPGTHEPGNESEVSAGHAPKDAELRSEMEMEMPLSMLHPFQDDSLSLLERVSNFNRFEWQVKAAVKECAEIKGEKKPKCRKCGRKHLPPCMTQAQRGALRAALKEGKKLRAEFNSAKNGPPTLPHAEMLERETVMARSRNGITEWTLKSTLCRICAKWHPGGAKACTTPFCTKGCRLNHPPWEACATAVKRFEHLKLTEGEVGEGEEKEKKKRPTPAPSQARAAGRTDTAKFGDFFNSLEADSAVLQAAGKLFLNMVRKRPAEESAEKADSNKGKEKKKKTGGWNSCQNTKPAPKGPNGPGGKGGKGARSLTGSIYGIR